MKDFYENKVWSFLNRFLIDEGGWNYFRNFHWLESSYVDVDWAHCKSLYILALLWNF